MQGEASDGYVGGREAAPWSVHTESLREEWTLVLYMKLIFNLHVNCAHNASVVIPKVF